MPSLDDFFLETPCQPKNDWFISNHHIICLLYQHIVKHSKLKMLNINVLQFLFEIRIRLVTSARVNFQTWTGNVVVLRCAVTKCDFPTRTIHICSFQFVRDECDQNRINYTKHVVFVRFAWPSVIRGCETEPWYYIIT